MTVRSARTKLVTADALAANLFLLGDAATEVRSRQYDYVLRRASLDLALASRTAPADRNDLATVVVLGAGTLGVVTVQHSQARAADVAAAGTSARGRGARTSPRCGGGARSAARPGSSTTSTS